MCALQVDNLLSAARHSSLQQVSTIGFEVDPVKVNDRETSGVLKYIFERRIVCVIRILQMFLDPEF